MNGQKDSFTTKIKSPLFIAAGAIFIIFVIIRICLLDADPPLFFTGLGQDLLTDPYNFVHYARSDYLFGSGDLFNYPKWIAFKYSFVSMLSRLIFEFGGVSRITGGLTAFVLSLAGIFFFAFGNKKYSDISFLMTIILLISNVCLMAYGGQPFLENGLIFASGLIWFLFSRRKISTLNLIILGILTAFCILSGKLYGIVMVVPIGLALLLEENMGIVQRYAIYVIAVIISSITLIMIYYGNNWESVRYYFFEQALGLYGTPRGILSPLEFIRNLMSFGGDSKFYYFMPVLLILLYLALMRILLVGKPLDLLKSNRMISFNLFWFLSGLIFLMVFNYQPLRYQLFLLLPITALISILFIDIDAGRKPFNFRPPRLILLLAVNWFFITQILFLLDHYSTSVNFGSSHHYYALAPAILILIIIVWKKQILRIKLLDNPRILWALILLAVMVQLFWAFLWLDKRTSEFKIVSRDLAQILDSEAVIAGPFSNALTVENNLRSFIYMFGLSRTDPDLFNKIPITHLAVDATNWERAVKDYPWLPGVSSPVSTYWIRDVEISIIMVGKPSGATQVPYELTDFERAKQHFISSSEIIDSALYYASRFQTKYPENKSLLRLQEALYERQGQIERCFNIHDWLIELYPRDFSCYYYKAILYYKLYIYGHDEQMNKKAEQYFSLARELNPYIDKDIATAKKFIIGRNN